MEDDYPQNKEIIKKKNYLFVNYALLKLLFVDPKDELY